jgi:hypothetical protein
VTAHWLVMLKDIEWDRGLIEDAHFAGPLPTEYETVVAAEDANEAIERGLSVATDATGFLIQGCKCETLEIPGFTIPVSL